jgi:hypothetical protein
MSRMLRGNHDETINGLWTFNKDVTLGGRLFGGGIGYKGSGKEVFVDPTNGSDGYDGLTPATAKASLTAGEDLLVANQNDILYYLAGSSSISLAAEMDWDKDYTHLVGVCAPTAMDQRARIFHSANFSPMFTVSAKGCYFANLYWSYGAGGADNHVLLSVEDGRNVFENCHFAGMNHATEGADAASICVELSTSAEKLFFKHCTFGNDTIVRTGANTCLQVTACQDLLLEDCLFVSYASAATPMHIRIGATGIDRLMLLRRCTFVNFGTSLTQSINNDVTDATNRKVLTEDCTFLGCDDVCDATGDGITYFKPYTATANVHGLATAFAVA